MSVELSQEDADFLAEQWLEFLKRGTPLSLRQTTGSREWQVTVEGRMPAFGATPREAVEKMIAAVVRDRLTGP